MGVTNSSGKGGSVGAVRRPSSPQSSFFDPLTGPVRNQGTDDNFGGGSTGQPRFGMPNQYANSVGASRWDNASLYPRQTSQPAPISSGKGGAPSGVGAPTQSKGKGGGFPAIQSAIQQPPAAQTAKPPVTPLQNTQANSAAALYASRGTPGDVQGMQYWQGRYAAGEDPSQIQKDFNASYDYVKAQQTAPTSVQSPPPPVMPTQAVAPTPKSTLTPEDQYLARQQDARLWDTQYG